MHAGSHGYAGTAGGLLFAAVFAVSLFTSDDIARDGLADDMISPWCRIGSLASWEGRPCALSLRTGPIDGAAHPR
jgi:hypothetical protein